MGADGADKMTKNKLNNSVELLVESVEFLAEQASKGRAATAVRVLSEESEQARAENYD